MDFDIRFSQEKSQILKFTRGVSFDDIRDAIIEGQILANIAHPSKLRPRQRMYIIEINQYAYVVPYVINQEKAEIFLKTAYASRTMTKWYLKGGKYGK
jgi:hypothetical protein